MRAQGKEHEVHKGYTTNTKRTRRPQRNPKAVTPEVFNFVFVALLSYSCAAIIGTEL